SWESVRAVPRSSTGGMVGVIAFSRDGRTVAVTHSPDIVHLLETATGRELASFEAPNQHGINHMDFNADGNQLAIACSGPIMIWDLRLVHKQLAAMNLDWDSADSPALST